MSERSLYKKSDYLSDIIYIVKTGKKNMSVTEQALLEKWGELPQDKQQQVLDFVEFLHIKALDPQALARLNKASLGERLRQIRAEPLLTQDEIEKEIHGVVVDYRKLTHEDNFRETRLILQSRVSIPSPSPSYSPKV